MMYSMAMIFGLNGDPSVVPEETSTSGAVRMSAFPPPTQSLGPTAAPPRDSAPPSSWYDQSTAGEYLDTWVTIFGFSQADTPLILKVGNKGYNKHKL